MTLLSTTELNYSDTLSVHLLASLSAVRPATVPRRQRRSHRPVSNKSQVHAVHAGAHRQKLVYSLQGAKPNKYNRQAEPRTRNGESIAISSTKKRTHVSSIVLTFLQPLRHKKTSRMITNQQYHTTYQAACEQTLGETYLFSVEVEAGIRFINTASVHTVYRNG